MMKPVRGVTLVELGVVLGVLSILVALAAPFLLRWLPRLRTDRAAAEIAANMRLVRSRAVREGRSYRVEFLAAENRYLFCPDPDEKGCLPGEPTAVVDCTERYPGVYFGTAVGVMRTSGDKLVDTSGVHFVQGELHFRPDGSASRGGSVYLIPESDLPDIPGRMRAVSVLFTTGRIKLWRYDSSAAQPSVGKGPWRAY